MSLPRFKINLTRTMLKTNGMNFSRFSVAIVIVFTVLLIFPLVSLTGAYSSTGTSVSKATANHQVDSKVPSATANGLKQVSSAKALSPSEVGQWFGKISVKFEVTSAFSTTNPTQSATATEEGSWGGNLTLDVLPTTCSLGTCDNEIVGMAFGGGTISISSNGQEDISSGTFSYSCSGIGLLPSTMNIRGYYVDSGSITLPGLSISSGSALITGGTSATGFGDYTCETSGSGTTSATEPNPTAPGFLFPLKLESGLTSSNISSTTVSSPTGTLTQEITTTVTLYSTDYTTLACHPYTQLLGRAVDCEATVTGNNPSGTVTFTAKLPDGTTLGPNTCSLNQGLSATQNVESCWYQIKSNLNGTVIVSARYSGDASNPSSNATTAIDFELGRSHLKVSCNPNIVNGTLSANCEAKVTGTVKGVSPAPLPTGVIEWNESTPIGVFSNSSCVLVDGSCGVEYSQGNDSLQATIIATYAGNLDYPPKQSTTTMVPIISGQGCADQTQSTGFEMCLEGFSGNSANITSTNYFSQPNGTGTAPPFQTVEYFDINVGGASRGTLSICYYGPEVNATTSMDYYYNGAWNAASNVNATAGVSVCGSIPVSALSGTPLAIGGSGSGAFITSSTIIVSSNSTSLVGSTTSPVSSTTQNSSPSRSSTTTSFSSTTRAVNNNTLAAIGLASILIVVIAIVGLVTLIRRRKSSHGYKT